MPLHTFALIIIKAALACGSAMERNLATSFGQRGKHVTRSSAHRVSWSLLFYVEA